MHSVRRPSPSRFSKRPLRPGLPLAMRITLTNIFAMLLLIGSLFYFGHDMDRFISAEVESLTHQAQLIGGTLGEVAIKTDENGSFLDTDSARQIIRRLTQTRDVRTQVFSPTALLVADSRLLMGGGRYIQIEQLGPPDGEQRWRLDWDAILDGIVNLLPYKPNLPVFHDTALPALDQIPDVHEALQGRKHWTLWQTPKGQLLLTVAVPVQRLQQVVGAVMLARDSEQIANATRQLRLDMLQRFLGVAFVGVLLSLYLAHTIARPLRRLAQATVGAGVLTGGRARIPDYTARGDEVGDLSAALRATTDALWSRLDAIERFAADVAHELKNPLTSLHSAVESAMRVEDEGRRETLFRIIRDDLRRMERLITDISAASRLEAELARTSPEIVDLADFADSMVANCAQGGAAIFFTRTGARHRVRAIPGRMEQVLQNLVSNALSFSPPARPVHVQVGEGEGQTVRLLVEDEGSGIPYGKEQKIFERFYSERPQKEAFGTHSGLGLSICRQIVEGFGGKIEAENRVSPEGQILGARFTVELPAVSA